MPAVVRWLIEDRLPELAVTGIARDHRVPHAPAAFRGFPGRRADARLLVHLRLAWPQVMTERAVLRLVLEQGSGHLHDHALTSRCASTARSGHAQERGSYHKFGLSVRCLDTRLTQDQLATQPIPASLGTRGPGGSAVASAE